MGLAIQLQCLPELALDISQGQPGSTGARNDNDIGGTTQRRVIPAKELAHQAAHSISIWCMPDLAAGRNANA